MMHPSDPNYPKYKPTPVAVLDDGDVSEGEEAVCSWCGGEFTACADGQGYCSKSCEDQGHEEWCADV